VHTADRDVPRELQEAHLTGGLLSLGMAGCMYGLAGATFTVPTITGGQRIRGYGYSDYYLSRVGPRPALRNSGRGHLFDARRIHLLHQASLE
jgi:hypothetical protein